MYHLVDNLQTKAGDALGGYYVKLKDADGNYATLYSDANSTPIATVSGVADTAVTDATTGQYDLYVADGDYTICFFDKNDINTLVQSIASVPMHSFGVASDITTTGDSNVQDDLDARVKTADLASTDSGKGAALVNWLGSWTGAVARSLADIFEDRVSVMHFIPLVERVKIRLRTSTADVTAYCQAALNTGKDVFFPDGTYQIDANPGLLPVSNQTLYGERGTILKMLPSDDQIRGCIFIDTKDKVTVRDLFIQGEKDIHAGVGTGYVTGDVVNVVSALAGTGMTATVTASNGRIIKLLRLAAGTGYVAGETVTLTANTGVGVGGSGLLYTSGGGLEVTFGEKIMGLLVYNSTNILFQNVRCDDCWGDGFYIGGTGVSGQSSNVMLINCQADQARRNGLSITAVDGCRVIGGKFTGSFGVIGAECGIDVEPNTGKGAVNNVVVQGATCTGNNGPGISASNPICTNLTVRDAYCVSNIGSGLNVGQVGAGFNVAGGQFNDNGAYGITIFGQSSNATMGFSIENVDAHRNTLSGIYINSQVMRFQILGGRVSANQQHGIFLDLVSGSYVDNAQISGVQVWNNSQQTNNTYDNIRLSSCHYIRVSGCTIRKNEPTSIVGGVTTTPSNKPKYGINAISDEPLFLLDNDVNSGGETAAINIAGNNVTVRGNLGFKTENRVLSPTFAVDAVATPTVTIPHGLAVTPGTHWVNLTLVDSGGNDFSAGAVKIQSCDATNVTARVKITGAAGGGATARLAVSVARPSVL